MCKNKETFTVNREKIWIRRSLRNISHVHKFLWNTIFIKLQSSNYLIYYVAKNIIQCNNTVIQWNHVFDQWKKF